MDKCHVAIVGGGISGLSTAYELSRLAAREKIPLKITLLEGEDRFGGVIRTFNQKLFTAEAAVDAFYDGDPWGSEAVEFCEALGLSEELVEASPSFRRFFIILKDQKCIPFPNTFTSFDPVSFFFSPLLSIPAKTRFLLEPWIPRNKNPGDESVGHFFRRRLGTAFYQEAIRPVVQGVYMSDPEGLSLEAVFPGLRKREQAHGSLAKAALADGFKKGRPGPVRFLNFKNGLESLIKALVRELIVCELRTASPVRQWGSDGAGDCLMMEDGETLRADAICLAMNFADAAPLLLETDPDFSRALSGIRYDSVLTFNFVFETEDLPRQTSKTGFIVPRDGASYPFSSLKWFDLTPEGKFRCLRVFISETMLPEVFCNDDETVGKKILEILREIFGIQEAPVFSITQRYPRALPHYGVGHCEKITRIEAGLRKHPGLFLTGNGFRGFGVTDCIHAAKGEARRILAYCQIPLARFPTRFYGSTNP